MTKYEFDYLVDGKYCVFFGTHNKFTDYSRKLMSKGYFVKVLDRRRLSGQTVYGNV